MTCKNSPRNDILCKYFTSNESLIQVVIRILPISYQKKLKFREKRNKFREQLSGEVCYINCARATRTLCLRELLR